MNQRGFTLIEVLISLVLFSALMLGAISLVKQGGQMRDRFLKNDQAIRQLQRAMDKIQQDLRFFEPSRGIRDEYFDYYAPMQTDNNGLFSFTRNSWLLPERAQNLRSDLQRVHYQLVPSASEICQPVSTSTEGSCLVRIHQYHLDQPNDAPIIKVPILGDVNAIKYDFLYRSSQNDESGSSQQMPLDTFRFPSAYTYAIEITIESNRFGTFKKLIALPHQTNWVLADDS
ncbi:type II secretion system protein GspJ [Marinicellulosiphila megalodicopiae]|uniref:type II secretion system protein GspJ n=1 Tax=Marinicellulosiphila megalodicopiae TaxID=2724896 RepID=UPI003BAF60C0